MKISVVIPALNEEFSIGATLEALLNQSLRPQEIIVADGGSTDQTLEVIRSFENRGTPIHTVKNKKRLPGAGRNEAIRNASYDFIACMDAGNIADCKWLAELAMPVSNDESIDVVYGRFIPTPETLFERCVASVLHSNSYSGIDHNKLVDNMTEKGIPFSGSSVFFKKSVWQRSGGFPDWLRASEDKLFGKKIIKIGCRVIFNPRAIIYHHMRGNTFQLFKQYFYYGKSNGNSRQTSKGFFHLLFKYIAGTIVLFLSAVFPVLFILLVLSAGTYVYRQGYIRYVRFYKKPPDLKKLFVIPLVLFTRDISTILGHFVGHVERCATPFYMEMLSEYKKADRTNLC